MASSGAVYAPLSLTSDAVRLLLDDDPSLIALCNEQRVSLASSPMASHFRVYALLVVRVLIEQVEQQYVLVEGTNCEPSYIGGAICAERSALCKLRFFPTAHTILKVVVTTDSSSPISPGMLCREFLCSSCDDLAATNIVMGNADNSIISTCLLSELFPAPFLYRRVQRDALVEFARDFVEQRLSVQVWTETEVALYRKAIDVSQFDTGGKLHPIKLAAACLFADGTIECAYILKGLEYGCSLDPVQQLLFAMENNKQLCTTCSSSSSSSSSSSPSSSSSSSTTPTPTTPLQMKDGEEVDRIVNTNLPVLLVQVDQFGIAHAPFASARALMQEHGFGSCVVLYHTTDGEASSIRANELAPSPRSEIRMLSHDDF